MNDNIVLNVHLQAAPGEEDRLAAELIALLAPTRRKRGPR